MTERDRQVLGRILDGANSVVMDGPKDMAPEVLRGALRRDSDGRIWSHAAALDAIRLYLDRER